MAQSLYRIYLYVVTLGSLIFAAVGANLLLGLLLAETPLRGTMREPPTEQELVQRLVFAVVSWVIAGALGGSHYWLIRRDMQRDSSAGEGPIRAFMLNVVEAGAVIMAVGTGTAALGTLAFRGFTGAEVQDVSDLCATALVAFGVAAALEWERRRTQAAPGLAMIFQRLHLYGVPLILVVGVGIGAWTSAVRESVGAWLYRAGHYPACLPPAPFDQFTGPCYVQQELVPLWGAALLVAAVWGAYALLARGDARSTLRHVFHLLGFTAGLVLVLVGVERGVEIVLRSLLGAPIAWVDLVGAYDFISWLVYGLIVLLAYGVWLRAERALVPMGADAAGLTVEAIVAAGLSVPFWWGAGYTLHNLVETVAGSAVPERTDWATALALLITGLGSIPVILLLQRHSAQKQVAAPYRAFVLGSLAAGALTGAVGLAIALYALGTVLLGAEPADWQLTARTGAVVFVVGAVIAGLYGWLGKREQAFTLLTTRAPVLTAPESRPPADTIEAVLDAFAAGQITREDAASQIREMDQRHLLPA